MTHPSEAFQGNGWFLFDEESPSFVKEELPAKPKLGEHRFKVTTLYNGALMVVGFENNGTPECWMVIPHPRNVL